jgi:outer membrane receptor protein involved in Fe transport
MELRGRAWDRLETAAALSLQDARWRGPRDGELPNAPRAIAQFRAAVPVFGNKLTLSGAARYLTARENTLGERGRPVLVADATATTNRLHRDFDLQWGVRNLTNRLAPDPVSEEHLSPWMPRPGRSVFVKLLWRLGE